MALLLLLLICLLGGGAPSCIPFKAHHPVTMAPPPKWDAAAAVAVGLAGVRSPRWVRLAHALSHKPRPRILVLGGSATAGSNCADGQTSDVDCAWPARLRLWLAETFGNDPDVHNLGVGGNTITSQLPSLSLILRPRLELHGGEAPPDAVFLDFSVNDSFEQQEAQPPTTLIAAYEAALRSIRRLSPRAVPVIVASCPLDRCRPVRDQLLWVAAAHGVPFVSFFDASRAALDTAGDASLLEGTYWNTTNPRNAEYHHYVHPRWETHQMIADLVARCVTAAACGGTGEEGEASEISAGGEVDRVSACEEPLDYFSAYSPPPSEDPFGPAGWPLVEDRPGKPGWVGNGTGALAFPRVRFGRRPRLTVTYLRSYEGVSEGTLRLNGHNASLQGLYPASHANVSQLHTAVFRVDLPSNAWSSGFSVEPGATHEVSVASNGRFKIVELASC